MNLVSGIQLQILDDLDEVARHAARTLLGVVKHVRIEGRRAFVALSGGSTPKRLFQLLAEDFRDQIPWASLEVFFGDERAVPPEHADSNYRLARETLFSKVPIPEDQIHRLPAEEQDLDRAAERYEALLGERLPKPCRGVPAFDLLWLGMGDDGHTASLFPGTQALDEKVKWVAANEVPQLGAWRLTLTFPMIEAARRVQFLVTGRGKAPRVREIFDRRQAEPAAVEKLLPAARARSMEGLTEWLLDREAARELSNQGF